MLSYLFWLWSCSESSDGRGLEDGCIAGRDVGDADVRLEGHHVCATENIQGLEFETKS